MSQALKRVYIRHAVMRDDDLFVPCKNLVTFHDLKLETVGRMCRLGVILPLQGLEFRTKDGAAFEDTDMLEVCLNDGQVVVASSGGAAPELAPHVRLHHPALKSDIRLWVPLEGSRTVADLRLRAELLLAGSVCPEWSRINSLHEEGGALLHDDALCSSVITSESTLYARGLAGSQDGGAAVCDEVASCSSSASSASTCSVDSTDLQAPSRMHPSSELLPFPRHDPALHACPVVVHRRSMQRAFETVKNAIKRSAAPLSYTYSPQEETVMRLPGGSFAVFGASDDAGAGFVPDAEEIAHSDVLCGHKTIRDNTTRKTHPKYMQPTKQHV
mmetsp:Transcript_46057/g.87875  ORF Transcript_46057/g.87875 Transcript_46057/m.87875 type:complete len:329 (-) Transcript_46057:152-1138(-)